MARLPGRRTAFVLAGGGSFGAVQVGMLQELLARDITPDLVVGASAGAINGAYLAGDPSPALGLMRKRERGLNDLTWPRRFQRRVRDGWRRIRRRKELGCRLLHRPEDRFEGSTPLRDCILDLRRIRGMDRALHDLLALKPAELTRQDFRRNAVEVTLQLGKSARTLEQVPHDPRHP